MPTDVVTCIYCTHASFSGNVESIRVSKISVPHVDDFNDLKREFTAYKSATDEKIAYLEKKNIQLERALAELSHKINVLPERLLHEIDRVIDRGNIRMREILDLHR